MANVFKKVYCAFCRLERNVCTQKHIGWTNVLLCTVVSAVFMILLWSTFDPRVIVIFAALAMFAEVFVHLRWRLTLPCPHCAFDPLLYKRNRAEASLRVKTKLDEVKSTGGHLLKANNPFQFLPSVVNGDRDETAKPKSSGLLSKQV